MPIMNSALLPVFEVAAALLPGSGGIEAGNVTISIETPMSPPRWAVLERELLEANESACAEFFSRYFDERGYLQCVVRWGALDGPDDAIENVADWPLLHALGASDSILRMYKKAWEGHLRQYSEAKTTHVELARDGMYHKEFPTQFDWFHIAEGLKAFFMQGLSDPTDQKFQERMKRFAGFYMNEDPAVPNYDPKHKIIRSLFSGSRGPLLREATPQDWVGDPIQIAGRFRPRHGQRTYQEMLEDYEPNKDIVGDHPQNLLSTCLATHAYMFSREKKYKDWVLEYVDAWLERTVANADIIPTKIGLDGRIGGPAGKWYAGVYGWDFTKIDPRTKRRKHVNTHHVGITGFGNALLLTGDQRYVDVWRRQIEKVNAQTKLIEGRVMYPRMHGDNGWYGWSADKYAYGASQVYFWSMDGKDLERLSTSRWIRFLEGEDPEYPQQALQRDLEIIGQKLERVRRDTSTPQTRLSDDMHRFTPASVRSLVRLMLGGLYPGKSGGPLHCRVRYLDPVARRAGLPADVAALVEKLTADQVTLALVNCNRSEPRTVVVQMGAYAEHECVSVVANGRQITVGRPFFTVRLAPGAGQRLLITQKRYAHQPTLAHPWDRRPMSAIEAETGETGKTK